MTRIIGPNLTELAIVGGGLSGLLTAWRALDLNPDIHVTVYEAKPDIGGDHTWSYNDSDVPPDMRNWFAPFARHSWDRYDVKFPRRERTLDIGYRTGDSATLLAAIQPLRDAGRLTVRTGQAVEPSEVVADAVLDARGWQPRDDEWMGYQKFVGHHIRTRAPHGVAHPVIMDATVEQVDGYRFMYLLPYTDTELLVEDTYFSDGPQLSDNEVGARIADYVAEHGWSEHTVVRTERGILPMLTATTRDEASATIGLRGGFAVAATGFTVPHALEVADLVATTIRESGVQAVASAVADLRRKHTRRERYARLLNRMFFGAASPEKRYVILQRFYGLREGLVRRFYRNALTPLDKFRILVGKPPVPVTKALYNFREKAFIERQRKRTES